MKAHLLGATLLLGTTTAFAAPHTNLTARHPQRLYFARGATRLSIRGHLHDSQHRFYVVKIGAGQHLKIEAASLAKNPDNALVPLIFVTPPHGQYDGDKTAVYTTNSSRAGNYKIEVAANMMASNSNSGYFSLSVRAK